MSGRTRLMKEMKESARDGDPTIALAPDGENLYRWSATLRGPEETPFETGTFVVRFVVPESYPLAPPKASFVTKIFHPNVHFKTGEICLDVLKDQWSPAWTLHSVCRAILALMRDPEPDSPLNCDAGNMLRARDDIAYWSMARMYTRREAGGVVQKDPYWPPIRPDRELEDWEREKIEREKRGGDGASGSGSGNGARAAAEAGAAGTSASGGVNVDGASGSGSTAAAAPTTTMTTTTTMTATTAGRAAAAAGVDARAAAAAAAAARFEASRAKAAEISPAEDARG